MSENDRRGARKLEHSYFASERQRHLAHRHDADYKDALKKRQIWCEGTFAAQKWGHNLTRVLRRGLGAAEDHCLLSATALNLNMRGTVIIIKVWRHMKVLCEETDKI